MFSDQERKELHALALDASREAGAIAMRWFGRIHGVAASKGLTEIVTEADVAVETYLRERLSTSGLGFLGEESGRSGASANDKLWVVDPIDGTTNFAHGVPHFGICVGLWEGEARVGVIVNPATQEVWSTDGTTAWLSGAPLAPLVDKEMDVCLMASGFPYDRRVVDDDNTREWRAVMKRCRGVRRMGAAALDLAYVASGRFDGFWEPRLKPWDVAAGAALVRAVGGKVTDFAGEAWNIDGQDGSVVAASPGIHAQISAIVQEVRA